MQTSYNTEMDAAIAGAVAESFSPKDLVTRFSDDRVAFGLGLIPGTDADEAKLPDVVTEITEKFGVAVFDATQAELFYAPNASLCMMFSGRIWVEVEENIAITDAVYVRWSGRAQAQTITFDADLVNLNVINMTIDGVAMATVTFAGTHDATMALLCVAIAANAGINTATCPGAGSRVITVTGAVNGVDNAIAGILVTLGVSQAGSVVAETVDGVLDSAIGKFRTDADAGTAALVNTAVAKWMSTGVANGLAKLQLLST